MVDLTDVPSTHLPDLAKSFTIEEYELMSDNRNEGICRSYNSGMYSMKEIGKHLDFITQELAEL